mgnify:CR=1 FL=1
MYQNILHENCLLSYRLIGSGKPVVLLHGFGEDSQIWNKQIDFLQNHCLLIIPDIPGSGKSEPLRLNNKSDDYISLTDYADCIYAILIAEKIDNCILLGHSMGGYISLAFAEKYPSYLNAFGLVHSSALADSTDKKTMRLRGIDLMEKFGAAAFLKNTIPNLFASNFKLLHPEMLETFIESSATINTKTCQDYYIAMMHRPDRTAVLKNTVIPVLFIIGTDDIAAPMIDVLPQSKMPINSYIQILDAVGHMGMWEATEKLNTCLLDFICLQ